VHDEEYGMTADYVIDDVCSSARVLMPSRDERCALGGFTARRD